MSDNRYGKKWTREETILAFDLYIRTPFGKIHKTNKDIIRLAELLGRTPSSVGLKMANLASCDPSIQQRGMQNRSKMDCEIWNEFNMDWETLAFQAQLILMKYQGSSFKDGAPYNETLVFPEGKSSESVRKERVGQQFFRNAVLTAYNGKCCVTGLSIPEMLVASHIKPWRDSNPKTERTNPCNGLCLNSFHDEAFDKGLITVDRDYTIILSCKLKSAVMDEETKEWICYYENREIMLLDRFIPDKNYIEYHNDVIFLG